VLIRVADKIRALPFTELRDVQNTLKNNLKDTLAIYKKLFVLPINDPSGFVEYMKIYFLLEISGFYSALGKIKKHLHELRKLFEMVGYLDALISIASFRLQYHQFCQPAFEEDNYSVEDIYHPLLEKPVSNPFSFDGKNIIITGSNMAGKTTFLKTLGVNAILAQTIYTSMAQSYRAPFIKVVSSIGRSDNLLSGKSYYLAEVESILRLIQASESETVHLFIIDEIFRGTNSVERLAASVEVLKYLVNDKDYTLFATHDLQLTKLLDGNHRNFHFQEHVSKEGLLFD
jgi:DNA mismatch repair ATPase MutS